jgi:hypothetical protein
MPREIGVVSVHCALKCCKSLLSLMLHGTTKQPLALACVRSPSNAFSHHSALRFRNQAVPRRLLNLDAHEPCRVLMKSCMSGRYSTIPAAHIGGAWHHGGRTACTPRPGRPVRVLDVPGGRGAGCTGAWLCGAAGSRSGRRCLSRCSACRISGGSGQLCGAGSCDGGRSCCSFWPDRS